MEPVPLLASAEPSPLPPDFLQPSGWARSPPETRSNIGNQCFTCPSCRSVVEGPEKIPLLTFLARSSCWKKLHPWRHQNREANRGLWMSVGMPDTFWVSIAFHAVKQRRAQLLWPGFLWLLALVEPAPLPPEILLPVFPSAWMPSRPETKNNIGSNCFTCPSCRSVVAGPEKTPLLTLLARSSCWKKLHPWLHQNREADRFNCLHCSQAAACSASLAGFAVAAGIGANCASASWLSAALCFDEASTKPCIASHHIRSSCSNRLHSARKIVHRAQITQSLRRVSMPKQHCNTWPLWTPH